jgi:hypothetical protein
VRAQFVPLLDELAGRVRRHGGGTLIFEGNDGCDASGAAAPAGAIETTADYTLTPRFAVRKADLTAADRAELDRIADEWRGASDVQVAVVGHTSSVGIAPRNRQEFADNYVLSRARAQSVAAYLQERLGLAPARIAIDGRGPDQPVADNATIEGRAQNRRVELRISGIRAAPASVGGAPASCDRNVARARAQNVFEQLRQRLGECRVCEIEIIIGDERYAPPVTGTSPVAGPNGE